MKAVKRVGIMHQMVLVDFVDKLTSVLLGILAIFQDWIEALQ